MIDCREYARKLKADVELQVSAIKSRHKKVLTLSIISVSDNEASKVYAAGKVKDCKDVGINIVYTELPKDTSEKRLLDIINEQNNNANITGIIVQLPLPSHINQYVIANSIDDTKDVDGFKSTSKFEPCTPLGIIRLLDHYNITLTGKHCVIVGRSELVGKSLARLMLDRDATVTICHSKTANLYKHTRLADIVVASVGSQGLITPYMVSDNAIQIDVGISRDEHGKLHGDFAPECHEKTELYTTVPNGIGLVTRVTLLENILFAFEIQFKENKSV